MAARVRVMALTSLYAGTIRLRYGAAMAGLRWLKRRIARVARNQGTGERSTVGISRGASSRGVWRHSHILNVASRLGRGREADEGQPRADAAAVGRRQGLRGGETQLDRVRRLRVRR